MNVTNIIDWRLNFQEEVQPLKYTINEEENEGKSNLLKS